MPPACAIEIDDAGVIVVDADCVRLTSPATAVVLDDRLEVGAAASAIARQNPRRTLDRFWAELDQEPLGLPTSLARHRADVAYFHLQSVWKQASRGEDEVVLAVSTAFERPQLSLLVGIAQACAIPLAGVVAAPLAAAATIDDPRPRLVLGLGLHRGTAVRVDATSQGLALGETRIVGAAGAAELHETWVGLIAERFVREARFDPLHDARTEQLLYDGLPGWLAQLRSRPRALLELPVGERRIRVEVTRAALVEAVRGIYRPFAAAAVASEALVLVESRLAALPGFVEMIGEGVAAIELDPGAAGRAALAHIDRIRSDGKAPAFVTRLPGPMPNAVRAPARTGESARPTHVLHRFRAYPIDSAPLLLDGDSPRFLRLGESAHGSLIRMRSGEVVLDVSEAGAAWVNGVPAETTTTLRLGDAVALAETHDDSREFREFRLIVLVPNEAPA